MDSSAIRSSRPSRAGPESASSSAKTANPFDPLDEVEQLAGPHLYEAACRLLTVPPAELARLGSETLARHLVWVARPHPGSVPEGAAEQGAVLVLRRRLIDLLRADILQTWNEAPPSPAEMLDTLQRLERARNACEPMLEQSFAAELADRGGLGLVVEVAHDMRSPLTSILFLSEILHRGQSGRLSDVQKRQVGIIYSAALGLVGMASDMIEVARGGKNLADTSPQPFSVNEILDSVRDLVTPTAEEKNLELRIGKIASANRLGHPIALSRVLLNLTTNALKFTNEGAVEVTASPVEGHIVEFAVKDSGPGISPEAMLTLYHPFKRVPRRETGYSFSGTGLGLAICRRLVSAMGSELRLETREQWGTRFSFQLELPPASTL